MIKQKRQRGRDNETHAIRNIYILKNGYMRKWENDRDMIENRRKRKIKKEWDRNKHTKRREREKVDWGKRDIQKKKEREIGKQR